MSYILYPIRAGEESPVTRVEHIPASGDNGRAAIGGRIALGDGREIYFVQSEAGEGWLRAQEGEMDAEAGVMELANGRINRLILVNGTKLSVNGQVVQEGDHL